MGPSQIDTEARKAPILWDAQVKAGQEFLPWIEKGKLKTKGGSWSILPQFFRGRAYEPQRLKRPIPEIDLFVLRREKIHCDPERFPGKRLNSGKAPKRRWPRIDP